MLLRLTGFLLSLLSSGLGGWLAWGLADKTWVPYLKEALVVKEGGKTLSAGISDEFAAFNYSALTLLGCLVGFIFASILFRNLVRLGQNFQRIPSEDKLAGTFGTLIGLGFAALIGSLLWHIRPYGWALVILATVVSVYLCVTISLSMKSELFHFFPTLEASQQAGELTGARPKLLDTNVIIDGRIAEICRTGFVEGPVYIPGFVLEELHLIADSADRLKRERGRRGLEVLNQMQQELKMLVRVYDRYDIPMPPGEGVDVKLVRLAKHLDAHVVTNDFNLNKVAQLQGVTVLNVNELANALKPVVLPGEELTVNLIKEGNQPGQGVGYLDDGTMVVVENGRDSIGTTQTVVVTTYLQTSAGKMIFAGLKSTNGAADESADKGLRAHPGGRERKKARSYS
jgi:uncharacterized protein YacL